MMNQTFWVGCQRLGIFFSVTVSMLLSVSVFAGTEVLTWVGDEDSANAYMDDVAAEFERISGVHIRSKVRGTSRGIRQVYAGQADLGGAGRFRLQGLPEEGGEGRLRLLRSSDSETLRMLPLVWDPLVVIVNERNPVSKVSRQQLKDIMAGDISNWDTLGGSNEPLHVYTRSDDLSGVGLILRKLLFATIDVEFSDSIKIKNNESMVEKVASDENAIGVVGLGSGRHKGVKILEFDGVFPSYENVAAGRYFCYRSLYLVTHPGNKKKRAINQFLDFMRSDWAMNRIKENGVVPYLQAPLLVFKVLEQEKQALSEGFR